MHMGLINQYALKFILCSQNIFVSSEQAQTIRYHGVSWLMAANVWTWLQFSAESQWVLFGLRHTASCKWPDR